MRRTDRPGLKAVYTVLELAEMSNVTKGVMRRSVLDDGHPFIQVRV